VFGRRAERAAYARIEGQPGAAAAALQTLRKGWTLTPAVAVDRQQNVVHRVVGRAGIVLVGEGQTSRVAALMTTERRRMARFLPDVPTHEVLAGNAEGAVTLRRLPGHVTRLPRALTPAQVSEVNRKLKALGAMNLPIPKGPLPRGMRAPRGPAGR
ncbi:MAG: DUF4191 family protein, partial [Actinomycetes bacterium]